MALNAALSPAMLARAPRIAFNSGMVSQVCKPAPRTSILARAEINVDDTPGVSSLLDRDFKIVELNEAAFAETEEIADTEAGIVQTEEAVPAAPSAAASSGDGPKRSKEAINAGLDLFSQGNYSAAVEMFQLALELPGSGFMRMAGSPKEYACASEGEEQAALYNMACAYCRMGQASAALTCLEALLESGFEDFAAIRSDPDFATVRGAEMDKIISKYDGPLAKLFGKKKKETNTEKPWIQW